MTAKPALRAALQSSYSATTLVVFSVPEWPEVDQTYAHMLLRLPDGYEVRLSMTDAQRLGARLNKAGGGIMVPKAGDPA